MTALTGDKSTLHYHPPQFISHLWLSPYSVTGPCIIDGTVFSNCDSEIAKTGNVPRLLVFWSI